MKWTEHADSALRMLLENMVAEGLLAERAGMQATPGQIVGASHEMLMETIRTSLPLARIMDTSDLVLHAEGPGVRTGALRLSAVNWLTLAAEQSIRRLSGAIFNLADRDAKALSRAMNLELTGFAPGSLYAGIAVIRPASDLLAPEDEPVFSSISDTLRKMPAVTGLIEDDMIDPAVREVMPDPARRDATFSALFRLAPTGRKDIHTVGISAPGEASASLGQRERIVLREEIRRPHLDNRKKGTFVGELREIDLDARRFQLRHVSGVGGLRCVIGDLVPGHAKQLLGEFVQVEGEYEADGAGRPRLMLVERVVVLPKASQPDLQL